MFIPETSRKLWLTDKIHETPNRGSTGKICVENYPNDVVNFLVAGGAKLNTHTAHALVVIIFIQGVQCDWKTENGYVYKLDMCFSDYQTDNQKRYL